MQDAVQEVSGALTSPVLDSILIENVALSASPAVNQIAHTLGRKPRGWVLVSPQKNATVWDGNSAGGTDYDKFLKILSSVAQTISVLVF